MGWKGRGPGREERQNEREERWNKRQAGWDVKKHSRIRSTSMCVEPGAHANGRDWRRAHGRAVVTIMSKRGVQHA
jgi:hypothetical protein